MHPILSTGLLIGLASSLITFIMGATGWYRDPAKVSWFLPVVMVIQVVGLIWGMSRTALQGRTYSGQVVAGAQISLCAGIVICIASLFFTMVAFPNYIEDTRALAREAMAQAGVPDAEIDAAIQGHTPANQAFGGFAITLVSGVIASAVIGVWVRARRSPQV